MLKKPSSKMWTDEELRQASHDIKNDLASILALAEMVEVLLPPEAATVVDSQLEKMRQRILTTSEKVTQTFQKLRDER